MKHIYLCLLVLSINLYAQSDLVKIADSFVSNNIKNVHALGTIVGVVHEDEIIYSKGIGKKELDSSSSIDGETLFRIGSITKTFTGFAIMLLRDQGLLSLDDTVDTFIPELRELKYPYANTPKISLRHLLTHTSGLIRHPNPKDQSIEGLIKELLSPTQTKSAFINSAWYPGYEYKYSNIGIALLGKIVENITSIPINIFIRNNILNPLDMNNTYWHESEISVPNRSYGYKWNDGWKLISDWNLKGYSAAGSLYSSLNDLSKWAMLQFKINPSDKPEIGTPFTIREMQTAQRLIDANPTKSSVGLIWHPDNSKRGYNYVGHNGKTFGYRASLNFDTDKKLAVIVMSNNANATSEVFGLNLLKTLQKKLNDTYAAKFSNILVPLLDVLKMQTTDYRTVFDKNLYSIYPQKQWEAILRSLEDKYGRVEKILSIEGINELQAILKVKTVNGQLKYKLSLSSNEEDRLSGILVDEFIKD